MASTGHYLATAASVRILEAGGNAFDAGVAGALALNVVQPEFTNLGGVAPIILYSARDNEVRTISGLGRWPQAISQEYVDANWGDEMPAGIQRTVTPAAADAWLTALKRYGTKTLAEVAAPAIDLAENGFPVYPILNSTMTAFAVTMAQYPTTASVFLPQGRPPKVGERLVQRELATTLRMLVEAEAEHAHLGREGAIQAARDRFYTGDIAERIAAFVTEQGGLLTTEDLASFAVTVESPLSVTYRGYEVFACRPWCQGPVVLQTLRILEGYDLAALGHNSADTLHLILDALKAAFADRERYYGDPDFVDVPIEGMLHPDYAAGWRERIALDRAFPEMPEPGDPWSFNGQGERADTSRLPQGDFELSAARDTSYLCVVDAEGNAFSATPSDGVGDAGLVPGLGFMVSDRGTQSWLDPNHPSSILPGKRPRLTPSPGLVMKDGKLIGPYGTPGGDVQPQAMVQFLVNLIDFGMDPQAAIEAPRVATYSFPDSFSPHTYSPGLVKAESRIPESVTDELIRRGHTVERWDEFVRAAGSLCAVIVDEEDGALLGAADPRRTGYAMGW
jgi:gamma-glutamyltranspeptidase/glutathione hydrolase